MNRMWVVNYGSLLLVCAALVSCATQPVMTQDQIFSQYPHIKELHTGVRNAKMNNSDLLAPDGFKKVNQLLEEAIQAARDNNPDRANQAATQGMKLLAKVNSDTQTSKDVLSEVLAVRERAIQSGAPTIDAKGYKKLEENLQDISRLIEKGKLEKAKKKRPELIDKYSQTELAALKRNMVDIAKAAIENANAQGAKKYAPKTMILAQEEIDLALSILDADRTQTQKANEHARRAKWLAERGEVITETIKEFERSDYTQEDVMLWYQNQLTLVNQPLGTELPFNEENALMVTGLQQSISKVIDERNAANTSLANTRNDLKEAETQIAELMSAGQEGRDILRKEYEQKLALSSKQRKAMERAEREQKARFEKVQSMFDASEANVYQQRQNVLISVHGFKFPTGRSEIDAVNFPLLNKITKSIKIFPNSRIQVGGHTDATGDDSFNQRLSQQRARKVARFLSEVGNISADRIVAYGFGESRPVASNETADGRAANRRVDIIIFNE